MKLWARSALSSYLGFVSPGSFCFTGHFLAVNFLASTKPKPTALQVIEALWKWGGRDCLFFSVAYCLKVRRFSKPACLFCLTPVLLRVIFPFLVFCQSLSF